VPNRVCTEEQQLVGARPSGAGAVIGAIAGGVLGHQIGGGFGRAAATGIGAVAGAAIGNGVEVNAANEYPPTAVPIQRCQTVSAYDNRTVGYDVVYEYAGRRYTTRTSRDPGPELEIDVRPVGAVSDAAPPARYLDVPPPPAASTRPPHSSPLRRWSTSVRRSATTVMATTSGRARATTAGTESIRASH
jgi:hypothetical protein